MAFPFQRGIGSELNKSRSVERQTARGQSLGNASLRAGGGSFDLIPANGDTDNPSTRIGDLPDGSQGVGALIDGSMVNLASYARAEKVRNDTQDTTLASHNTRITTAQSTASTAQTTANGAVTVNGTQNSRLNSLESSMGGAASQSQVNTLIDEIGSLKLRVIAIENMIRSLHPGVLP